MIELIWSPRFEKKLQKYINKHPHSRDLIKVKLELFSKDPFASELKNHKLSGKLKGLNAITIEYDCRIDSVSVTNTFFAYFFNAFFLAFGFWSLASPAKPA